MAIISNARKVVDSSAIIEQIESLELDLERLQNDDGDIIARDDMTPAEKEAFEEWSVLKKVSNEAAQYCDSWEDGADFVSGFYLEEYVRNQTEESEILSELPTYITDAIDWRVAVEGFKEDWTPIDWDGVEFWVQNCC